VVEHGQPGDLGRAVHEAKPALLLGRDFAFVDCVRTAANPGDTLLHLGRLHHVDEGVSGRLGRVRQARVKCQVSTQPSPPFRICKAWRTLLPKA
jgi:hypothetical protein